MEDRICQFFLRGSCSRQRCEFLHPKDTNVILENRERDRHKQRESDRSRYKDHPRTKHRYDGKYRHRPVSEERYRYRSRSRSRDRARSRYPAEKLLVSETPCRYFLSIGCRYGNNCRFYHDRLSSLLTRHRSRSPRTTSPKRQSPRRSRTRRKSPSRKIRNPRSSSSVRSITVLRTRPLRRSRSPFRRQMSGCRWLTQSRSSSRPRSPYDSESRELRKFRQSLSPRRRNTSSMSPAQQIFKNVSSIPMSKPRERFQSLFEKLPTGVSVENSGTHKTSVSDDSYKSENKNNLQMSKSDRIKSGKVSSRKNNSITDRKQSISSERSISPDFKQLQTNMKLHFESAKSSHAQPPYLPTASAHPLTLKHNVEINKLSKNNAKKTETSKKKKVEEDLSLLSEKCFDGGDVNLPINKNKKDLKDVTIAEESDNKMQGKSRGKSSSNQSNALPSKENSEEKEKQNVTVNTDETYPSSSKAGNVKSGSSRSRSCSEDSQGRPKPGSRCRMCGQHVREN